MVLSLTVVIDYGPVAWGRWADPGCVGETEDSGEKIR